MSRATPSVNEDQYPDVQSVRIRGKFSHQPKLRQGDYTSHSQRKEQYFLFTNAGRAKESGRLFERIELLLNINLRHNLNYEKGTSVVKRFSVSVRQHHNV